MPRKARQNSESGICHIIILTIKRQIIFDEDEDRYRFLQTLKYYKYSFMRFNEQIPNKQCLDVGEKNRLTDKEVLDIMKKACKIRSVDDWQKVDRNTGDNYLGRLKQEGLSVRQISRLTGLNRGIVLKA